MAWSDPKTWTADDLLTASDMNQYVSDNLSALYNLVQGGGRKSILHNGAMQVTQRSVGPVASITTPGYYTADRWNANVAGMGTWTQSVEQDAPTGSGFRNSLKMLVTTADASPAVSDFAQIQQRIEGRNLQVIKKGTASAEPVTLSFWVKSNKTGVYVVELMDVDNSNRHVSATYTVEASGIWEQQTVTFPADATGAFDNDSGNSLSLNFWLGAGTDYTTGTLAALWQGLDQTDRAVGQTNLASDVNNYWSTTGVQLEVGSSSTGFEFKDYADELLQCQRYYKPGDLPLGALQPYAGSAAPTGWLLCYGQAISRTTYSGLFSAIGTAYGTGDGSTTFNLPDLRGRTVAALDNMGGSDAGRLTWANTLGTASGTQTHTLTSDESGLPAHNHTQNAHTHTQDAHSHTGYASTQYLAGDVSYTAGVTYMPLITANGGATSLGVTTYNATATNQNTTATNNANTAANASSAHNNMQPTMLLNYIIRALGDVAADL